MTINTINNTSGPYVGNGLSDTFDYDFKIFEESQLVIYETDDIGNVTTLQLGTDYSVNILSDAGGTVTRLAGPLPAGYTWYIKSNYRLTQDISFTSQGAFFPQIHEDAFDKFAMITQQLSENLARSLRVPDSESNAGDLVIPDAQTRAGRVLAFNEQGKPVEFSTMNQMNDVIATRDSIKTVSDNITAVLDAYQNAIDAATSEANAATSAANAATSEANAATSAANAATSEANTTATLNEFKSIYHGALPTAPTDATVSDGDLYFDTTLDEMRVYNSSVWKSAGSTVNGTVKRQTFTASGGEVTFTITGGYDGGYADVYLNGVKLVNGVDVDISSGADIVLTESASAGDTIDFIGYGSFDVADTYSRAVADSRFAKIDGDSTQKFKVADAVTTDEAVNLNQLINYTNLTYVQYSTNDAYLSIPQPSANTWFDLPEVNITIPENGTYLVIPAIRMYQNASTAYFAKKHRLLKNGVQIGGSFFSFNKGLANTGSDSTCTFVFTFNLKAGDVIQAQGYWYATTTAPTAYSDGNGSTSIVAVRIGE